MKRANAWKQVDDFVRQHKARVSELHALARASKRYLKPRFVPPSVWVLRTGDGVTPPQRLTFHLFHEARAHLEAAVKAHRTLEAAKEAARE